MNPVDEKRKIQLNLVTKMMEKTFFNLGLDTNFDLTKIPSLIDTKQKYLPLILLYEDLISKSPMKEIEDKQNFEKIFFGLANFYYNSNEYFRALEKIEQLLSTNPNNINLQHSKDQIRETLKQSKNLHQSHETLSITKQDCKSTLNDNYYLMAKKIEMESH